MVLPTTLTCGNRSDSTFIDGDLHRYAVTRLYSPGLNLSGIAALGDVLTQQLITHTFKEGKFHLRRTRLFPAP